MTVVGKIFVFLVLILSLVQGTLAFMLYTARTHWVSEYDALSKKYKVEVANAQQFAVEVEKAKRDAKVEVATVDAATKKLQAEVDGYKKEIADMRTGEQQREKSMGAAKDTIAALQADVKRRQDDVDHLKTTLTAQMDDNKKLLDQGITLRQDKVTAEIKANALAVRNDGLETQLRDLLRDKARNASALAGSATKTGTGKNPPQENIEGLIRQTDPSGLVKITIGSDAGLVKGNTLEVFRLSSVPDQSKYLGTIKIIDVSATEAVGQPMGRMAAPVQTGDRVASRILGG